MLEYRLFFPPFTLDDRGPERNRPIRPPADRRRLVILPKLRRPVRDGGPR